MADIGHALGTDGHLGAMQTSGAGGEQLLVFFFGELKGCEVFGHVAKLWEAWLATDQLRTKMGGDW